MSDRISTKNLLVLLHFGIPNKIFLIVNKIFYDEPWWLSYLYVKLRYMREYLYIIILVISKLITVFSKGFLNCSHGYISSTQN